MSTPPLAVRPGRSAAGGRRPGRSRSSSSAWDTAVRKSTSHRVGAVALEAWPRPPGGGSPAARPAGPGRRWWRRCATSRPTGRGCATGARRPARPRRSAGGTGPRSWAGRWRRAPSPASSGRHEVGVEGEARVAADAEVVLHPALGGQPVVVPAHRVEDRLAPHPLEAGHRVGVGVREDVADVQRARHRGRRGVDGEHPVAGGRSGRRRRCRPPPSGRRPGGLEAFQAGLLGDAGGAVLGRRRGSSRRSSMIGLPYPACCASTTPPPARSPRSASGRPARSPCTCAGPRSYGVPHLGHGRLALVFDVLRRYLLFTRARGHLRLQHHRHRRQDHRPGRRPRACAIDELTAVNEALWWEIIDALGVLRPDETPHATAYVDRMVALIADLVARGVAYETADGVYLSVDRRARLRAAGPPAPRLAAVGGPGRGRRGEAVPPRLRAVEEGQAGRAHLGVAVGAGPARLAHRVRGHVPRPAGRRLRPPRRGTGPRLPPPRERAGPGGGRRAASSPATGCTTGGSPWTARRCPSPSATSPRSPTCWPAATPAPTGCWSCAPTTGRPSR